jgi:uncharacterized membrane protein (Fun14 family)
VFVWGFREKIGAVVGNVAGQSLKEILFLVFLLFGAVLTVLTFLKNYSLIPILAVLFCSYLLVEIPAVAWMWFFAWMGIGLIIYFSYGYWKSKIKMIK